MVLGRSADFALLFFAYKVGLKKSIKYADIIINGVLNPEEKRMNKPILSISIMVSNRIDTIRNCMESIKPLLEGFPCELVVLDTVGEKTDGSIDVAREYTDKVYRFEWCNDFAKARNYGLERCSGEWFMFMDDDEWFDDVTEILEFFTSGEYKKYNCANYKIHTYSDYEGNYGVATLMRMVKRTKETRFVSRVHEYLTPICPPAKEFSAFIHHYGYRFDTAEEREAHSRRNIDLLLPDFEEDPWNLHVRVQLLQEYIFMAELKDKAEQLCWETLQGDKKYYKTNEFQWSLFSYVKMANKEGDFEKVIERAEYARKNFPLGAMADIAISTIELNARCKLEQYAAGVAIMEHAIERREYLLKNPEVKQYQQFLDFATFFEDSVYSDFLRLGIRCCYNVGKKERARELFKERTALKGKPVITISLLVSNRKDTIRKCLDSIQPLLCAMPSELIVVDTVGEDSDGSLEIAKEYTDHIVPFVWCDDFAAARNAGLQVAKGEWFLYLDDDEWFENVDEIIEFFISGEYTNYNSATYLVRNYKDLAGTKYSEDEVGRMIHRAKNSEFVGCVNETFSNLYSPHKAFTAYVHHYGFVYKTDEVKKRKMQYTFDLLQRDLERYPKNLRNRAQLTAVMSVDQPKRAVEICEETLELCTEKKDNSQYQWQIAVLFGLYERLQMPQRAEEQYEKLKKEESIISVAERVACYRLTRSFIMAGEYASAFQYATRYFEITEEVLAGEVPSEFLKYQDKAMDEEMLPFAAFCAWQAKDYGAAWHCYEMLAWERFDATAEDTMWKVFALAEERTDYNVLFRIVKRIMTNAALKPVLGRMMQTNPRVKQRINEALSSQRGIKLSIGILVSNRIDTIEKCLESVKPLLEAVPSELIVLDTVGENSDGSAEVARRYTDKVYRYEWCNDFADARNTCLAYAKGEWFLFVDDDEWFDSVEELINFFKSGESDQYRFGTFLIRNYNDKGGYSTSVVTRMVRRTEQTHFVGKIHEVFHEVCPPGKQFSCFLHHEGYRFADDEAKRKHQDRNVSLLEQELKENGMTARYCAQYVQELFSRKETETKGWEYLQNCLPVMKENGLETDSCVQWMLVASVRYFRLQGDYEGAKRQAERVQKEYNLSSMAKLAVCAVLVPAAVEAEDYRIVPELAEEYLEQWNYLMAHPEEMRAQSQLDFPKYLEENYKNEILQTGATITEAYGKKESAGESFSDLPQGKEERVEKEIIVTVSLLVSNRIDTIRKCMDSIKPLLDAVPSELIAVDTIGEENSDGSIAVVKEYTDHIVRFEWCNDFAAARNVGLLAARGKWFLFLDDDEWFEDISPIIEFFTSGEYKKYDRGWYYVRNYNDYSGIGYVDTLADRMCKITKESRFVGRVHESLRPYPEKVMQFNCYAHHYGYVFKSDEDAKKHSERNIILMEQEIKERADDARMAGQLVQEYAMANRVEDGLALCENWLNEYSDQERNPFTQFTITMWLRLQIVKGDMEEAARLYKELQRKYHLNDMAKLAFLAEGVNVALRLEEYETAYERAEQYFLLRNKIVNKPQDAAFEQVFDFKQYLADDACKTIMQQTLNAMLYVGPKPLAKSIFDSVDWADETNKPFGFMMQLVELYGKYGEDTLFFPYAEKILNNSQMKQPFMVTLEGLVRDYPERLPHLLSWLKQKVQLMINEGNVQEARELLEVLKTLAK